MATVEKLTSIYSSHQLYIERFATGQGNAVTPYLEATERRIAELLNSLPSKPLSPERQSEVQAEIDAITREELQSYTRELKSGNLEFAVHEAQFTEAAISEVLIADVAIVVPTQAEINRQIVSTPIKLGENLYSPYNTYLSTYWRKYTEQVNGIVINAFATGLNNRQVASQILDEIKLTSNLTDKTALDQAARGANTLARTGTNHAATSARLAFFDDNDVIIGYRSISTLDSRTSQQCRSLDQVVMKKSDPRWSNFVTPSHPNCRRTLVPEIDGRYSYDDDTAKRPSNFTVDGKRDPKQVSSKSIYYDDMAKISARDQNEILGPTLGRAFRKMDDPKLFAKQTIDSLANPLTITELKKKDNELGRILRAQNKSPR